MHKGLEVKYFLVKAKSVLLDLFLSLLWVNPSYCC